MPKPIKIVAFAGSTRKDSINKKLAQLGVKLIKENNIEATFVDLADYPLPLYDGDFEAKHDYPEKALELKNILKDHDGFLLASPEYNSSISAVLKNSIDWVSRSTDKGTDLSAFSGKVVALVSASPGQLGGLRGLTHVREILTNIGCLVIPNQLAVPGSFTVFDDNDQLKDDTLESRFKAVVDGLTETTKRFQVDL